LAPLGAAPPTGTPRAHQRHFPPEDKVPQLRRREPPLLPADVAKHVQRGAAGGGGAPNAGAAAASACCCAPLRQAVRGAPPLLPLLLLPPLRLLRKRLHRCRGVVRSAPAAKAPLRDHLVPQHARVEAPHLARVELRTNRQPQRAGQVVVRERVAAIAGRRGAVCACAGQELDRQLGGLERRGLEECVADLCGTRGRALQ
jgi:hypothetical protein